MYVYSNVYSNKEAANVCSNVHAKHKTENVYSNVYCKQQTAIICSNSRYIQSISCTSEIRTNTMNRLFALGKRSPSAGESQQLHVIEMASLTIVRAYYALLLHFLNCISSAHSRDHN